MSRAEIGMYRSRLFFAFRALTRSSRLPTSRSLNLENEQLAFAAPRFECRHRQAIQPGQRDLCSPGSSSGWRRLPRLACVSRFRSVNGPIHGRAR